MIYYRCVELTGDVCTQWVMNEDFLNLPEGSGLEIGGALFLLFATAWSMQFVARFLLNR